MKTMMTLGILALAGGCVTDEDSLGEATQELNDVNFHTLSASAYDMKDLGVARGRACFLASIQGDISASGATPGVAGAGIDYVGGHWQLYVRPSSGTVTAKAVCVDTITMTTEVTWSTGQASQFLVSAATNNRCFLTEVTTSPNQPLAGGLHTDSDVVEITNSGGNWRLGGSTIGLVTAKARCIVTAGNLGEATVWAPAGQTLGTPTLVTDDETACMLTRVNGHFDASGTGLSMSHLVGPSGNDHYWSLHAVNASGGSRRCVD